MRKVTLAEILNSLSDRGIVNNYLVAFLEIGRTYSLSFDFTVHEDSIQFIAPVIVTVTSEEQK